MYRFANPREVTQFSEWVFGGYCIFMLIVILVGWATGATSRNTLLLLLAFLAVNIAWGKIVLRVSLSKYTPFEYFRIFFINGIFCPILYLKMDGVFSHFWYVYLIPAISGGFVVGLTMPSITLSVAAMLFWGANLAIAGAIANTESGLVLAMQASSVVMAALATWRVMLILRMTVLSEEAKALELEDAMKRVSAAEAQLVATERLAALGEMSGNVAHEVNTPLAVIQLHAGFLKGQIDPKAQPNGLRLIESSRIIIRNCARISGITQALRTFAQDAEVDHPEVVSARELLDSAIALCKERFDRSGFHIELSPELDRLSVRCRKAQTTQAILNLLHNSLEAIAGLADPWIRITADTEDEMIRISIIDSGHGIAPEIVSKLFQPFFSTKGWGKGAGLGLSVARGISESNEGSLRYDASNAHTRFILSLPRG